MKNNRDNHLYERLNNNTVVKNYVKMIETKELELVNYLYSNISLLAGDHPKFHIIETAYMTRINDENNKTTEE